MSEKQQKMDNLVPDATAKVIEEDKFAALYESSRTDSGFLSGGNLMISGEIVSEEIKQESGYLEEDKKTPVTTVQTQSYMRLDSGVDLGLSESFSNLSLKNPNLNDLSSTKVKEPANIKEPTREIEERLPWEIYFEQDEDGDTQLHAAIMQGFIEVALALIRISPHPRLLDTPNDDAQSPLHLAVATGQARVARWLIVAGARPCPRNLQGDSPLHIAARTGDVYSCKAITDPVQQQERDALALSYPPQPYKPYDLEQWNYEGQTCVHVAALNGHVEVLRHLVWYGADINAREGKSGYTVLHYAIERADERLLRFLLTECKKLDASVKNYGGQGVLGLGYQVPSTLREALKSRGAPSPYSSDESDEEDSSDDEIAYEMNLPYRANLVNASA